MNLSSTENFQPGQVMNEEQKPIISTSAQVSPMQVLSAGISGSKSRTIHINNDDNYATPPEFYNKLDAEYHFDFDPCPYCEGDLLFDGLKIEWGDSNYVNPPYSQKLKEAFVKKGIEEMKKGKLCVFLIPVSTSTVLFHKWIKPNATKIEFVEGRIKFGKIDDNGNFFYPKNAKGKISSGTKDSMIVVFDGRTACR